MNKKKLLALLMALVMTFSLVPVTALAEITPVDSDASEDLQITTVSGSYSDDNAMTVLNELTGRSAFTNSDEYVSDNSEVISIGTSDISGFPTITVGSVGTANLTVTQYTNWSGTRYISKTYHIVVTVTPQYYSVSIDSNTGLVEASETDEQTAYTSRDQALESNAVALVTGTRTGTITWGDDSYSYSYDANDYYDTFAHAYAATEPGDTITLLKDVTLDSTLTIDKAIVLDGNGNTLTSNVTNKSIISVSGSGNFEMKNLRVHAAEVIANGKNNGTNADIYLNTSGVVKITGCTFTGAENAYYNVIEFGQNVKVADGTTITGNTFDGAAVRHNCINLFDFAGGATVDVSGNTFNNIAQSDTNPVRISDYSSAVATVNLSNSTYSYVAPGDLEYAGFVLIQDVPNKGVAKNLTLNLSGVNVNGNVATTNNNGTANRVIYQYDSTVHTTQDYLPTLQGITLGDAAVAQIGNTQYATLAEAFAAAVDGDTITLLADVANAGKIHLPAGVTLDGSLKSDGNYTISGNSTVYINAAGGTVRNVKFENISNGSPNSLSAVYAGSLSGTATITGCSFHNQGWDAIQITPIAGASITITNNEFNQDENFSANARRYVHIQSGQNVDFGAIVTGNTMHGSTNLMYTGLEIYFPADWNNITLNNNYIDNPIGVCLIGPQYNQENNAYAQALNGFVTEDNSQAVTIKASVASGDADDYDRFLFPTVEGAVAWAVANNKGVVTLEANATLNSMITLTEDLTLDLNGHTLSGATNTSSVFQVVSSATLTINGTTVNSAVVGRINVGKAGNDNGNVVLNGGSYSCGNSQTVLHINGECRNSNVTIRNARIESPNDNGIQLNGSGTFLIENSEITGATGVYVKSGDLTITNSSITGNMSPANYEYFGNGAYATGDAIVIDSCNYPGGAPLVKIGAGNTFTGTKNQVGYYVYNNSAEGTVLAESAYTLSTNADKNWVDNDDDDIYTKKIGDVTYVAQIGNVKYETLQAAIAAAHSGDTITLLADVGDANSQFGTYKSMTLDLGGHTLTCAWLFAYYNATLTVENGTINGNVESYGIYGAPTVTIASDATVNGYLLGWGNGNEPDSDDYYQPTLNVYGKVRSANYFAICTNGMDNHNPIINIYDGAEVTSTTESAIYLPSGTLNIVGGTITGATGVYFKSKTLNITGGTITGNGTKTVYTYNGNGANATGDALVIDSCNYPNGISDITVSGGTFTSENGFAVGSYNSKGGKLKTSFITGGTFSSDPMNFTGGNLVKESYAAVQQGDTYKVGVVSTSNVSAGEKNITDDTVRYGITTTVTDESNDEQLSQVVSSEVTVAGTKVENNAITVTDSNVKAVGAASLDSVNSASMEDVVSNAIVSAGDDAASVSRIELVIVSDSGTKVTDSNNAVTSVTYEVHPEAIAYTVVSDTATKVGSYKITNDQLAADASFTIKLPVPDAIYTAAQGANPTSPRVKVTHYSDDANYGDTEETLGIQGTEGNYFVVVITDHFSEFALEPDVTGEDSTGNSVYACNLLLQGIVKVQYALNLTADIKTDDKAYVVITMPNVGVSETIKVSAAADYSSYKVVAFSVAAQYMDEDTYVTLYDGNGIEVAFDNSNVADGDFAGSYKYGVYSYLDSNTVKNGSVYLKNLASSMKTYNQYAKYYFHPTEVTKPTLALPTITSAELNTYVKATSGSVGDLSMYAANLQLKASTTVQIAYSGSIDGVTFSYTLNDVDTGAEHKSGDNLTPVKNGNYWVIAVTDIAAQYLDDILTVTATKDEDSYAVTYSPFTYVSNKLSSTTVGLSETVRAFYGYNQAANAYFANK